MTREHSQASKSSTQRTQKSDLMCRAQQQQLRPGHKDSGSVRSMSLCGSLSLFQKRQQQHQQQQQQQQEQQQDSTPNVEQQHHNHQYCHQSDSKKTFSGLEASSGGTVNYHCDGQQLQQPQSTASPSGTENELSSDDQPTDSRGSEEAVVNAKNRMPSSIVLKKQLIYYQGKFKPVFVQVWPDAHRIPLHERHRLQDPMRQHYGKLSRRARLLKEFEHYDKPRSEGQPIPLLPKRMRDEAKVRLMAWYRPLDINCGHTVTSLSSSNSSRQPTQAVSSR